MIRTRSGFAWILLAVAAGCSDHPASLATAPVSLDAAGATVETGSGVFTFDAVVPFKCTGENVRSIVYAPYSWRRVQLPSGEYVYVERWDTDAVTGTLIGQTTGTIWVRTHNVTTLVERSTGGGMLEYTFSGTFVSETAPLIRVSEIFHVSRDASGRLTAQFSELSCVR